MKRFLTIVLIVMTVLCCASTAMADGYAHHIDVSVAFYANAGSNVALVPISEGAPAPMAGTVTTGSDGTGRFMITFYEPGTYKYSMQQNGVMFDVDIYVMNAGRNDGIYLEGTPVSYMANSMTKVTTPDFRKPTPTPSGKGPETGETVSSQILLAGASVSILMAALVVFGIRKTSKEDI